MVIYVIMFYYQAVIFFHFKTMGESAHVGKQWDVLENNGFFLKSKVFFDTTSHMIYFDYKAYALYKKTLSMFNINILFITQSRIEVTVL